MARYKSQFLRTLAARGFVHQLSDAAGLDALAARETLVGYIGFDCTAQSLHVGNLLSIMMLHHLQQSGGKPLIVLGGGTSRIGDPSGRDDARRLLAPAQIAANKRAIRKNFTPFLRFGAGKTDAIIVDNAQWLNKIKWVDFLRDYGRHFSVNRMLGFDSVRLRLQRDQNLSFLEFNYMIAQAYDFLELYRRYGCRLQLGGSDQWGNIVNGIELTRRLERKELYALTCPLLTNAAGDKMGKTAAGAVWLDAKLCPPVTYWQFWRDCADADVARFLRLYTRLPLEEITALTAQKGEALNQAKRALANAATRLLHGEKAAAAAESAAAQGLTRPQIFLARTQLQKGMGYQALFKQAGLAASHSEARRLIVGGGARLNDKPVRDPNGTARLTDMRADGSLKLSAGKKRHVIVKLR